MRKHADTRFWISIFASAIVFPAAAIATFIVWFIRLDLPPPADATPNPAMLAASHPIAPVRVQVEAVLMPPPKAIAEPAAPPPTARAPEPLSTMPALDNTRLEYADPVEDTPIAESHEIRSKPATEAISEQPKQQIEGTPVAASPPPDAKVPENALVTPVIAAAEAASLIPSNTLPAHTDLPGDASPTTTATIPTEPAVPEPFMRIERPIMLPKPRPQIAVANVSRTAPLPRPRPIEIGLPRASPDGE
jgi:hypothetical protein